MEKVRMGTEIRGRMSTEALRIPGPGAYNPEDKQASQRQTSPGWGIGKGKRASLSCIEPTPGPAAYQVKGKLGEAPKYAMRPKTAGPLREHVPGPGQYTPLTQKIKKRPPSAVIGRGSRQGGLLDSKKSPGPGAYNKNTASSRNAPAYSFGSGRKMHKAHLVPGPGTYNIPCTFASLPRYSVTSISKEFGFV